MLVRNTRLLPVLPVVLIAWNLSVESPAYGQSCSACARTPSCSACDCTPSCCSQCRPTCAKRQVPEPRNRRQVDFVTGPIVSSSAVLPVSNIVSLYGVNVSPLERALLDYQFRRDMPRRLPQPCDAARDERSSCDRALDQDDASERLLQLIERFENTIDSLDTRLKKLESETRSTGGKSNPGQQGAK